MTATNVVVLVMDTVRMRGVMDDTHSIPELQRFASSGTCFDRAFTSAPWTLPAHASLFTGTTPSKHGAHAGHKRLDDTHATLASVLEAEGFETVAVSNNTWISEEFGFGRGFETFHKTWQYVQSNTDLGRIARQEEGIDKIRKAARALFDGNPVTNLANAIYGQFLRKQQDDGARQTNEWIDDWLSSRDDTRPFFLFANYLEPHLEYRPPEAYADRYLPEGVGYEDAMAVSQDAWGYIAGDVDLTDAEFGILRSLYRAEIAYLGDRLDDLVGLLKAAGEWEETLFVVTSDHGENIGEHGLMDHQYALYDTLLHVPLFVHGGPFDDKNIDNLVQLVDIPPTVLDVLDIGAPGARDQFQGVSFHPDTDNIREYATAEYMAPQPSMTALEKRVGDLPEQVRQFDRGLRAIRTDQYKYIRGSDGSRELYDIQTDPRETTDIAGTSPERLAELNAEIDAWLDSFEQADHSDDIEMTAGTKQRLEDLGYLQ